MLGTTQKKRDGLLYLNIREGKILHKDGPKVEEFDFVEGLLEGITRGERNFNGEAVPY